MFVPLNIEEIPTGYYAVTQLRIFGPPSFSEPIGIARQNSPSIATLGIAMLADKCYNFANTLC